MTLKDIDQTGWLIIGIAGVVVLYEISTAFGDNNNGNSWLQNLLGIPDPTDTTGNPNSIGDTSSAAYAGSGIFGWLGNVVNKASGGVLQSAGNSIGGQLQGVPFSVCSSCASQ
jgi:hypothetical protein